MKISNFQRYKHLYYPHIYSRTNMCTTKNTKANIPVCEYILTVWSKPSILTFIIPRFNATAMYENKKIKFKLKHISITAQQQTC